MKLVLTVIGAALLASPIRAEMFLSSSNQPSSLIVASNEAIVISAARKTADGWPNIQGQITIAGQTNALWLDSYNPQPTAIAGPASLTFSNPVVLCFRRLPGNIIRSVYVSAGDTNNQVITVPEGKACRFFYPAGSYCSGTPPVLATITSGFKTVSNILLGGTQEITGPASVIPTAGVKCGGAAIVSYYFTEDAAIIPELGLQGPTGSFEIVIEKSVSLTNWLPVVIHSTSADERGFYRLRISR